MTMAMHLILKYPPHSFGWSNTVSINIFLDFIYTFSIIIGIFQYNSHTIASFVDVFIEVFECKNTAADFDIDVSIISFG